MTSDPTTSEGWLPAAQAALEAWGLRGAEVSLLKQRENAVFAVTAPNGHKAALRLHRPAYHAAAALRSELAWIEALAASGLPTPAPRPTGLGELLVRVEHPALTQPRYADLLEWVAGSPVAVTGEPLPPDLDIEGHFRALGTLTAQMHDRADAWRAPAGFTRHCWDRAGLVGEAPLWGRFWEHPQLDPHARLLLQAGRMAAAEDLSAYAAGGADYGLIHADLIPENVLASPEGLQLIDFDDSGYGWRMFDLATTLFVHLTDPAYTRAEASLFEGYGAVRPVLERDRAQLPLFMFLRASTYLGWLQTRPESEEGVAMTPMLIDAAAACAAAYLEDRS